MAIMLRRNLRIRYLMFISTILLIWYVTKFSKQIIGLPELEESFKSFSTKDKGEFIDQEIRLKLPSKSITDLKTNLPEIEHQYNISTKDLIDWNIKQIRSSSCCFGVPNSKKAFNIKYRTCAIVASSGHLVGSRAGREIDRNDCVIRINEAPTKGYEKDVGRKTTLRYMAPFSVRILMSKEKKLLKELLAKKRNGAPQIMLFYGESKAANKLKKSYPLIDFYGFRRQWGNFSVRVFRDFGQKVNRQNLSLVYPSSGFRVLLVALKMCRKVTFYGISPPSQCISVREKGVPDIPYHYYDPPAKNKTSPYGQNECFNFNFWENSKIMHHNVTLEKYIYLLLAKSGVNINFRFPSWTQDWRIFEWWKMLNPF